VSDSFDDAQLKLSSFRRWANKLKRPSLSVDEGKSWPTPILTSLGASPKRVKNTPTGGRYPVSLERFAM